MCLSSIQRNLARLAVSRYPKKVLSGFVYNTPISQDIQEQRGCVMIQDLAAQSTAFEDSSPAAQMTPNPFASSLPSSASTQSPAASLPGKFSHMSPGSVRGVHPSIDKNPCGRWLAWEHVSRRD